VTSAIKLSSPATGEFWEIPVVHEDAHLLALDKPAGLLTSPDPDAPQQPSLMKLLHADIARGAKWVAERNLTYLANLHWLDGSTSGVFLLAKDKPVFLSLADQFGIENPGRVCLALVHGSPREDRLKVAAKLGRDPARPGLMRVDPREGKPALTQFEVIERFRSYTLLKCLPHTDRTHQIHVHLQNSGLPIVADGAYGGRPLLLSAIKPSYRLKLGRIENPLLGRSALHNAELRLAHPVTGKLVEILAPWPHDLAVAVKYLRKFAAA
jgi:RluA family pseudouridine synthase